MIGIADPTWSVLAVAVLSSSVVATAITTWARRRVVKAEAKAEAAEADATLEVTRSQVLGMIRSGTEQLKQDLATERGRREALEKQVDKLRQRVDNDRQLLERLRQHLLHVHEVAEQAVAALRQNNTTGWGRFPSPLDTYVDGRPLPRIRDILDTDTDDNQ